MALATPIGLTMGIWMTSFSLFFCFSLVQSQVFNAKKIVRVELTDGKTSSEGNVMVTSEGDLEGRPLCDDSFGMAEANAVCVTLGFPRAISFTRKHFYGIDRKRWTPDSWKLMYNLECPETNSSINIQSCTLTENRENLCTLAEVAGVLCQRDVVNVDCNSLNDFVCVGEIQLSGDAASCIDESRLCDGVPDCSGGSDELPELCNAEGVFRLESNLRSPLPERTVAGTAFIKYNGTWSSVCNRQFDAKEAKVICRNLGYRYGKSQALYLSFLGRGTGPIFTETNKCEGDEKSLIQCPEFVWAESEDCNHFIDAGVLCHDGDIGVQLVGGRAQESGRLELTSTGFSSPAAVCGQGFDDLDAQVVCRMLGYDGINAVAAKGLPYGVGSGPILNIILDCLGNETSIQDCRFMLRNDTCSHLDTAAVTCIRQEKSVGELLSRVLPADCGEPVDSSDRFITSLGLIRGGAVPSMFDVPWLAGLRFRAQSGDLITRCGASVISEYYLLTVAHCFRTVGKLSYVVTVGEFNNKRDESFQQTFELEEVYVHEKFGELEVFDNDIALLKVKAINGRGIKLGDRVKPVCLPNVGDSYNDLEDATCMVAGWGRTSSLSDPTILPRVVRTFSIDDFLCERFYGTKELTSSQACFFNDQRNPCKGDSGGPVTCRGAQGRQFLYGIVSFGDPCVLFRHVFDLNTRVTKQLRWIQETIYRDLRLSST